MPYQNSAYSNILGQCGCSALYQYNPEYSVEGKALVCEALNIGFVIPIVLKKKL